jgi:hypothetical protein
VGPFAVERGLVGSAPVRIHMVNSGSVATASFPGADGLVDYDGDTAIAGVPGTAAAVVLDFTGTEGSATGALLPTGNVTDVLAGTTVTCVDNGMPVVVVPAADLGRTGYGSVAELERDPDLGRRVRALQLAAGAAMGLGDVSSASVPKISLATRIPGLVRTDLDAIKLDLEDDEELQWSGLASRLTRPIVRTRKIFGVRLEMANPAPTVSGKMFVTDKRLVWLAPGEMGYLGGRRVEIRAGEFASVDERRLTRLSQLGILLSGRVLHLLLTLLLSPIEVSSTKGDSYTFYVLADRAELLPYLTALRGAGPGRAGSTPSAEVSG